MSDLEIFKLGITLAQALQGEQEAIADLAHLFKRHPEMFKNLDDLKDVITKTALEPDYVMENKKAKNDKDFIAAKQLDEMKMSDIGVRNEDGTNIIFHANKKKISEFDRIRKDGRMLVETPSAEAAPTRLDHCADKSSDLPKCDKAPSTSDLSIIPQKDMKKTEIELEKRLGEIVKNIPTKQDNLEKSKERS